MRSERLLMEQIEYNLLFRCFVGLPQDELIWDEAFFRQITAQARAAGLLSGEHFTVDGTLLEVCAGHKRSGQRKRKLVEQPFGWMKTVGLLRKLRHRGQRKVGWTFTFTAAVHNLVRMRTLGLGVAT